MKKIIIFMFVFIIFLSSCSVDSDDNFEESSQVSNIEISIGTDVSYIAEHSIAISDFINESSECIEDISEDLNDEVMDEEFMKGVWISQFDMSGILKENGVQRDRISFEKLYRTVLSNIKNDGYNTVFVQVRPYADSFYPSEYFPPSNYVTGDFKRGLNYDPFAIIVELSKEIGLFVHAWLNPMRAMKSKELVNVDDKYPIKQWYNDKTKNGEYIVEIEGRYYLNPAYDEVRALIAKGAKEVAENYDIDGVHIDDYFYPTKDASFDSVAYQEYIANGGNKDLRKYRNEILDLMVSEMYSAVKSVGKEQVFGISPAGNIENTYNDLYTDVYKWCSKKGYIDYICPQIYFGLEHQTHDFIKVFNTWNSIIKIDSVKIYAGMTLGKAKSGVDNYAGKGKLEWTENKDVLKRCLEFIKTRKECQGIVMFCYQHMYDPITGISVAETQLERDNMKSALNNLS